MKIIDKKILSNKIHKEFGSKFINIEHDKLNIKCNILSGNFYIDSHNFFPLTEDFYSFSEIFSWGDFKKYNNFYSENFIQNFSKNKNKFKEISDVFILGSSYADNYYRNIMSFLPRIFFNTKNKIKFAIHRNSSNKIRSFIKNFYNQLNIEIKFIYLDDGFYKFNNSEIPQFINKSKSIEILNRLNTNNQSKKNKIYITRRNCTYRNLINEEGVIKFLKSKDFKVFDMNNLSISEQIDLFSNAEIIISPSGSALANLVFCSKGTKVFEISPKYNHEYENVFKNRYSFICDFLNLEYNRIESDSIDLYENNINKNIDINVALESNYYKNLIVKLETIHSLFKS